MKRAIILTTLVFILTAFVFSGDFTTIGVKKCKMCHKGEKKGMVFEKWKEGPHAKAFETLKAKGEDKNPACLGCHTTAFNKGGYKVGDANAAAFEGVQCESCHGPGSAYKKMSVMKDKKLAMENGLLTISEATCKNCHNDKSPTFKGFDYAEYSKKIDHTYK